MSTKKTKKPKKSVAVETKVEPETKIIIHEAPMQDSVPPIEIVAADLPPVQLDRAEVARRAYQRFIARGGVHGHAFEDWLAAENELRKN